MGRSLVANEPCQICGDRSFGRHYGLWTCDGCSCFFKRSIRRNIQYTCISGLNNCPVDKTRRNWCPACRLRKCLNLQMNRNAVQKERGPRRKRLSRPPSPEAVSQVGRALLPLASSLPGTPPSASSSGEASIDYLLLDAMAQGVRSSVIVFLSHPVKLEVLKEAWPLCFVLCTMKDAKRLQLFDGQSKLNDLVHTLLDEGECPDPEEVRLLLCLLFCALGTHSPTLHYAVALGLSYRLWLRIHCDKYHPEDGGRWLRLTAFLDALVALEVGGLQTALRDRFSLEPMLVACLVLSMFKEQTPFSLS